MKTCVLITTAREKQAAIIYSMTQAWFDVKFFSKHDWENNHVTPELEDTLMSGDVDYLFSFCCPLIVPEHLLLAVRNLSVNLHPSPPEYPGVKGAYRACWDKKTEFGVTAHLMEAKVDTGKILKVKRFPIANNNDPASLTLESFRHSIDLYQEVVRDVACGLPLASNECWSNFTMTRKNFEILQGDINPVNANRASD